MLRLLAVSFALLLTIYMSGAEIAAGHDETALEPDAVTPFATLMHQAMDRMDRGMDLAPMSGDPDRDFLRMMIPHHQGAVDMAKIVLLHGKDPRVRNLAQGIVADQQNEIRLMQSWLEGDAARAVPKH